MDSKDLEEVFKGVLTDESQESQDSAFPLGNQMLVVTPSSTGPSAFANRKSGTILFSFFFFYSFSFSFYLHYTTKRNQCFYMHNKIFYLFIILKLPFPFYIHICVFSNVLINNLIYIFSFFISPASTKYRNKSSSSTWPSSACCTFKFEFTD